MTRARKELVDLKLTAYYHCTCRCVRLSFLCGEDHLTGHSYRHRKAWFMERLEQLSRVFAVEVCAFAVMPTRYDIVVYIDEQRANAWSEQQVLGRWKTLFKAPLLLERYMKGVTAQVETKKAREILGQFRHRLADLNWYMRTLNEYLARKANKEECCKGRFWEGRYTSVPVLDDAAVLSGIRHVDLNPNQDRLDEANAATDCTDIWQRFVIGRTVTNERTRTATEPPACCRQDVGPIVQVNRRPIYS